ncbi:MAG: hypothetical protein RL695_706 [Pseudomonadota bacterium]|jgi:hypothetical protein
MPPKIAPLPPLAPVHRIARPLTGPEYYHACIGQHPRTLIQQRDVVAVLEGKLEAGAQPDWQAALDQVVAANPGCCLRLSGKRQNTRWSSDGQPPRLRLEPDCCWDGRSSTGDDFIYATPLSLEEGPTGELIVAGRDALKVIVRFTHAVMDGMGVVHFLQEIFRALRGEPLLGSNATYTDLELMRHVPSRPRPFKFLKPLSLTGAPQGEERGGQWRRVTLPGSQPHLIPRVAQVIAEHARRHEIPDGKPGTVRIALPVSLKRHAPELLATTNFTSMMYLDVAPGAEANAIKRDLDDALERNLDTNYPSILEAIRYLPLTWLDRIVSLTDSNYTHPRLAETAVFSVMSPFRRTAFSGGGFRAETLYGLPQKENAFVVIVGFQGKFELLVGMSHLFASAGRLDVFIEELQQKLTTPA